MLLLWLFITNSIDNLDTCITNVPKDGYRLRNNRYVNSPSANRINFCLRILKQDPTAATVATHCQGYPEPCRKRLIARRVTYLDIARTQAINFLFSERYGRIPRE